MSGKDIHIILYAAEACMPNGANLWLKANRVLLETKASPAFGKAANDVRA